MKWIDLRSDTVTEPTQDMLDAMRDAVVGDDVYEDDPTVKLLQDKAAEILGKEASLFVPTGTFANQLSILTHCKRGDEAIVSRDSHIFLYEVGGAAALSNVQLVLLKKILGVIDIDELKSAYRGNNIHFPDTGLICTENAHSDGAVVPLENMQEVYEFSRGIEVPVHLDGARIFNASTFLKIEPKEITKYCDSVMFCISKGLCSPIGSILLGKKDFIEKAKKYRKMMGGGMRQVGYLAAAGLISLEKMIPRLYVDHENAKYLAKKLEETGIFKIDKNKLDINMVFCKTTIDNFNEKKFISYLIKNNIKINPSHDGEFRFVTHYWVTREKIDCLIELIKNFS